MVCQREEVFYLNRNEYRRALLMLRSLQSGVSGYVRLERRTLMGTLQFTVNGVTESGDLYAVLLYYNGSGYSGIRLGKFAVPRYGQTGLVWKFDPRNIESRELEQYELTAVIEIRKGICELLLCGNLNGAAEVDWIQVRDAACRLFSPVHISGTPISPITERNPVDSLRDDHIQTLPEYNSDLPAFPGKERAKFEEDCSNNPSCAAMNEDTSSENEMPTASCICTQAGSIELDMPAQESEFPEITDTPHSSSGEYSQSPVFIEPDDFDLPAQDERFLTAARVFTEGNDEKTVDAPEPDELDIPASDEQVVDITAGEQLPLTDPNAIWPASVEALRALFFSSKAVILPFEMEEYIFIRVPLHMEDGTESCFAGIACKNGLPDRVCYAIPAPYTPEPPVGLEGYVWQGDLANGCWVICEEVTD